METLPVATCELVGGLGNQLFILAATLAYARRHGLACALPAAYAGMRGADGSPRPVYWDTLLRALRPLLRGALPPEIDTQVVEDAACFTHTPCPAPRPGCAAVRLRGYFQHLAYADDEAVVRELGVGALQGATVHDAIALHFRLGDYQLLRHLYPAMTAAYYARALEHVARATGRADWAVHYALQEEDDACVAGVLRELRARLPAMTFTRIPAALADWEQFLHMSCCRHNIIANSTFSWWAARLNRHGADAVVVCPRQWMRGTGVDPIAALAPAHWAVL